MKKDILLSFLLIISFVLIVSCKKEEINALEFKQDGFIKCAVNGQSLYGEQLNEFYTVNQYNDVSNSSYYRLVGQDSILCVIERFDYNNNYHVGLSFIISPNTAVFYDYVYSFTKINNKNNTVLVIEPVDNELAGLNTEATIVELNFDFERISGKVLVNQRGTQNDINHSLYSVEMDFDATVYELLY